MIGKVARWWSGPAGMPAVAFALALGVVVTGGVFRQTTAGGADAYGYVSQVDGFLRGQPMATQPWADHVPWPHGTETFTPLGYNASRDRVSLLPMYAPGLPLVMAVAKAVAGHDAIFWVSPIAGGWLVWITFALGARLATRGVGLAAAWLMATSPAFLFMLGQPMSDVPASALWAAAIYLALGTTRRSAVWASIAALLAVLIRLNLAPLILVMLSWLIADAWRHRRDPGPIRWRPLFFLVGGVPALAATFVNNWIVNGSPFVSGYGGFTDLFAIDRVWPNASRYGVWLAESQTPLVFAGFVALLLPIRHMWPASRDLRQVVVCGLFVLGVWAAYLVYLEFDAWWFLRFLLPSYAFLMVGTAAMGLWWARRRRLAQTALVAVFLLVGVRGVIYASDHSAFDLWREAARYSTIARQVRAMTTRDSVVLSRQHSGTLRLYGGRLTLRYEALPPYWLDDAVAWLASRGVKSYALLETWELPHFRERFAGMQTLTALDRPPLLAYTALNGVYLFPLNPPEPGPAPSTITIDVEPPRSCPPFIPMPTPPLRIW